MGGLASLVLVACITGKALRARASRQDGWHRIDYGTGHRTLALVMALISLFMTYAASRASADQLLPATLVASVLDLLTILVLYEVFIRKLRWNTHEIQSLHPHMIRRIPWEADTYGGVSPWLQMGWVRGADGTRIWIPLATGTPLLARYGRLRERSHLFNRILEVRPGKPGTRPLSPEEFRRIAAARNSSSDLHIETHELEGDRVWSNRAMRHNQVADILVCDGSPRLVCGDCEKTLPKGTVLRIPSMSVVACTLMARDSERAKLQIAMTERHITS